MEKYFENIKKNILWVSIWAVGAWWATLLLKDSLVYAYIGYVALFLVILFYGAILYLIYKNDKFSKLLKNALYTIYSLCFLMSSYVLLTPADVFLLNAVYLFCDIIFALVGWIYGIYLVFNRKKLVVILERYSFLGLCFFFVTYLFMIYFVRYIEFV